MLVNDHARTEPSTMSVSRLIEIQEKTFQKQLDWIRQADKKAQILIGTNLATIADLKHERIQIASSQLLIGFVPWALAIYLLRSM